MTPAEHIAKSKTAHNTGVILSRSNNEWASVLFFYAAFRAASAAIAIDERLNTDESAKAVHHRLLASSRAVNFHNGHPDRGPGMNDIVRYMFPKVGAEYELLHTHSHEVRYADGLSAATVHDSRALAETVIDYFKSLSLYPEAG